jgi:hypothetical protein
LITWWPRPFQTTIGARRLQLKSDSSPAARTVTHTVDLGGVVRADPLGVGVGQLDRVVGEVEPQIRDPSATAEADQARGELDHGVAMMARRPKRVLATT